MNLIAKHQPHQKSTADHLPKQACVPGKNGVTAAICKSYEAAAPLRFSLQIVSPVHRPWTSSASTCRCALQIWRPPAPINALRPFLESVYSMVATQLNGSNGSEIKTTNAGGNLEGGGFATIVPEGDGTTIE